MGQNLVIVSEHDGVQLQLFPHSLTGDVFVDIGGDAQWSFQHLRNEGRNRDLLLDPDRGSRMVVSARERYRPARVHNRDQAHGVIQCTQNILRKALQAALIFRKVRLIRRELADELSSSHTQPSFPLGGLATRDKNEICAVAHVTLVAYRHVANVPLVPESPNEPGRWCTVSGLAEVYLWNSNKLRRGEDTCVCIRAPRPSLVPEPETHYYLPTVYVPVMVLSYCSGTIT